MSLLIAFALFEAGCLDESEHCDPGQRYDLGVCRPDPPDGGAGSDVSADAASGAFGSVCASTQECTGQTDLCAIQPGAAAGFCTHDGCKERPEVCPSSWRCMDLSSFQPGLSLCVEP
jgi:hypothetical protein